MSSLGQAGAGGGLLALVAVAAVASLGAGGAGATEQSAFQLPRAETLYMSGSQWGPYTNSIPRRPDYNTGTRWTGLRDALPVRPAQGPVHPLARDQRQVGWQELRREPAPRSEMERWQAAHAEGREVHVRPASSRAAAVLTVGRPGSRASRSIGQRRRASRSRAPGLPALRLLHLLRPDRAAAHLVKNYKATEIDDRQPRDEKIVGTGPVRVPAGAEPTLADARVEAE